MNMWKLIIRRAFRIRRQYIFSTDNPASVKVNFVNAQIHIENITSDNVHRVVEYRSQKEVELFRVFLRQGQFGIYALLNSKVVGYAWAYICRQNHCRVNGYMDICQGEALIHNFNVSESARRQHVGSTILETLCHRLSAQSEISRVSFDIGTNNVAAFQGVVSVGFEPIGIGWYLQIGGRLLYKRYTPLSKATMARGTL